MRYDFPWLWKVESRRLLWLLALTFALVVTFQYIELPYDISSIFSTSKIPISRNGEHRNDNVSPAPAPTPSFFQKNYEGDDGEVEVDRIFDTKVNATAPAVSPAATATAPTASAMPPAALLGLHENATAPTMAPTALLGLKENATAPTASAKPPAALPVLNSPPVKENATMPSTTSLVPEKNSTKKVVVEATPVVRFVPNLRDNPKPTDSKVVSISDMSEQLRRNRISQNRLAKKPKWVTKPDLELLQVKHEIENAPIDNNDPLLYAPLYRNVSMFKRSYELMEKMLKVYVYKEGSRPIMHSPIMNGIYASEGWFMKIMESNNNKFVTKDASKAHLFYLPFSSRMLEVTLYVQNSHSHHNLIKYLKDYIDLISVKYHFWNRTSGADHFLAACHDWATSETRQNFAKSIRALCNSDVKEGFVFGKDTALPETYVRDAKKPLSNIGGKPASRRPILAFFAGKPDHGYVRPILLRYWGNSKDPDLQIFGKLPRTKGNKNYLQFMKTSKYCICAKGYEVNSPRVVEAIFYDCVPVIISDNFVPPFFEVLNWESFALFIPEKDIPNLKTILMSISERRYKQMQMRVKKIQKHFLWHMNPEKYDMFHMILHSIWFNRVFQITV